LLPTTKVIKPTERTFTVVAETTIPAGVSINV
jgi:hypothetical protein